MIALRRSGFSLTFLPSAVGTDRCTLLSLEPLWHTVSRLKSIQ